MRKKRKCKSLLWFFFLLPSQPNGFSSIITLQATRVKIKIGIVEVDARDSRIGGLVFLVLVKDQDGQVEHDDGFDFGDIIGVNPVLGRGTFKRILIAVGVDRSTGAPLPSVAADIMER